MAPIDLTEVVTKKYAGKWIVLSLDKTKVLIVGKTLDDVLTRAEEGIIMLVQMNRICTFSLTERETKHILQRERCASPRFHWTQETSLANAKNRQKKKDHVDRLGCCSLFFIQG